MTKFEQFKRPGIFTLSSGKEIHGELTLAGPNTSLYLHDKEYFNTRDIVEQSFTGVLQDLTKVSLIGCITGPMPGSIRRGNESRYFAEIFAHYVVLGDRHITHSERTVTGVRFVVDDASSLFYDFDAFGSLIDARPFIEEIAKANALDRKIATGPDPEILYFTGKREIFAVDTVLGRISAYHSPSHNFGGPDGVSLKNTIFVAIAFKEAVNLETAISHTFTLVSYLGVLVGRPQNLRRLNISVDSVNKKPVLLDVYWSMPPKRESSDGERKPHPTDALLDAVRQPGTFSRVLSSWLGRQQAWHDARLRFFNSFAAQQHYGVDRLIGSANMFDILPSSALAPDVQLSAELKDAKDKCRNIFEQLEASPERDSILSALGRVGKSGLKQKIRHRARPLIDAVGDRFPELVRVINEAVNCRNHYVHGSEPRFNYGDSFAVVSFFTDTLEFIFAASDLVEAGWDVKTWTQCSTTMSHPFARYRVNYGVNLRKLKAAIPETAATPRNEIT